MADAKWSKSPEVHVEAFAQALPASPEVERRRMFGYPCAFVNGNMFCGLHESNICVRLGAEQAASRIAGGKARVFSPMAGRVMKEYVAIPAEDCADPLRLRPWLAEAFRWTAALPAKTRKAARVKDRPRPPAPRPR